MQSDLLGTGMKSFGIMHVVVKRSKEVTYLIQNTRSTRKQMLVGYSYKYLF